MKKQDQQKDHGIVNSLDRGLEATRYLGLFIVLIILTLVIYAIAGTIGAIITVLVVSGIGYAVKSGKLKLY